MIDQGVAPDVISSDVHVLCVDGPAHDLLAVMSKFLCLEISLVEVVLATSAAPAKALRRSELGTLKPGRSGDATVLEIATGAYDYVDVNGVVMRGDKRLANRGIVIDGAWWHPVP